jgi:fatty-acyl-CoA synthase
MADAHQGGDLRAILASVRDRLPALREVISFGDWDAFAATGAGGGPLPPVAPADIAQLLYTSGTTGRPKGALLTHRALTNNARLAFQAAGIGPDDILVNPMPPPTARWPPSWRTSAAPGSPPTRSRSAG